MACQKKKVMRAALRLVSPLGSAVAETTFQDIHRLASLWLAAMVRPHGATHGLSPRSFPCFPGSVLPRLHGVAPFFRPLCSRCVAPPRAPTLASAVEKPSSGSPFACKDTEPGPIVGQRLRLACFRCLLAPQGEVTTSPREGPGRCKPTSCAACWR